jgi:hypothetical protein
MDNKAYEQYKAQQPHSSNVELRKSHTEVNLLDQPLSNTELAVFVVTALLVGYALFKIFRKDNE